MNYTNSKILQSFYIVTYEIYKIFFQFLIIIFLFLIFKVIGYRNASNLGASIGKKFGKIIKSDKVILKNLSIIQEFLKEKLERRIIFLKKFFPIMEEFCLNMFI